MPAPDPKAAPSGVLKDLPRYRQVLLFFALFDTVLGPGALLLPNVYLGIMHTTGDDAAGLLARTATLWSIFAATEWFAFLKGTPAVIALVAVFRFMDIPADLVYLASARTLSVIGSVILVAAALANGIAGVYLWRVARRADGAAAS
ncbi:MAG: hypothetical protein HYY84_02325 [Deltaproteobacteria bacterium]|nr:hypothetical protein [Deltaproteobacteria bacterium]